VIRARIVHAAAVLLVSAVTAAAQALPKAATPEAVGLSAERLARLTRAMKDAVDARQVAGTVTLVVRNGQVAYHDAQGAQDIEQGRPMRPDSIFRIASMTKAVTSVATMMMVEQGKLKLDDDVSTYLPAFKSMQVLTKYDEKAGTYETRPNTKPITIRQLLTHTSGIGYSWSDPGLALVQRKTDKGGETELPLVHDPGAKWTYGASTKVLGDVVEKLSGERIDAFTDRHIAKPLGMSDTFYEVPKAKYARVVTTHQKDAAGKIGETQNPDALPVSLRADGGLFSTAPDYAKFLQMLLNGGQLGSARLLKASTVAEMLKPQTNGVRVRPQPSATPTLSKPYPLGAGEDIWGLGFQLADPKSPNPNMRRPGAGNWAGIFNTFFWVDPKAEVGVVVMMQMLPFYDEAALDTLRGVEQRVYSNLK
jgi:CubicO group peptidase (beta-lactamase class C family)